MLRLRLSKYWTALVVSRQMFEALCPNYGLTVSLKRFINLFSTVVTLSICSATCSWNCPADALSFHGLKCWPGTSFLWRVYVCVSVSTLDHSISCLLPTFQWWCFYDGRMVKWSCLISTRNIKYLCQWTLWMTHSVGSEVLIIFS